MDNIKKTAINAKNVIAEKTNDFRLESSDKKYVHSAGKTAKSGLRQLGAETSTFVHSVAHGAKRGAQLVRSIRPPLIESLFSPRPRDLALPVPAPGVPSLLPNPLPGKFQEWVSKKDDRNIDLIRIEPYEENVSAPADPALTALLDHASNTVHTLEAKDRGITRHKKAADKKSVLPLSGAGVVIAGLSRDRNSYAFRQAMRLAPSGAIANYLAATNSSDKITRATLIAVLPTVLAELKNAIDVRQQIPGDGQAKQRVANRWRDAVLLLENHFHSDVSYKNYAYRGHRNIVKEAWYHVYSNRHKYKSAIRAHLPNAIQEVW